MHLFNSFASFEERRLRHLSAFCKKLRKHEVCCAFLIKVAFCPDRAGVWECFLMLRISHGRLCTTFFLPKLPNLVRGSLLSVHPLATCHYRFLLLSWSPKTLSFPFPHVPPLVHQKWPLRIPLFCQRRDPHMLQPRFVSRNTYHHRCSTRVTLTCACLRPSFLTLKPLRFFQFGKGARRGAAGERESPFTVTISHCPAVIEVM